MLYPLIIYFITIYIYSKSNWLRLYSSINGFQCFVLNQSRISWFLFLFKLMTISSSVVKKKCLFHSNTRTNRKPNAIVSVIDPEHSLHIKYSNNLKHHQFKNHCLPTALVGFSTENYSHWFLYPTVNWSQWDRNLFQR